MTERAADIQTQRAGRRRRADGDTGIADRFERAMEYGPKQAVAAASTASSAPAGRVVAAVPPRAPSFEQARILFSRTSRDSEKAFTRI
jgi:hypothetical protein